MNDLKERLEEFANKLENDPDYEMSEEMREEYIELKRFIESCGDLDLEQRFKKLAEQYENPDSLEDSILKDMFPDTDGEFDLDDFWKN